MKKCYFPQFQLPTFQTPIPYHGLMLLPTNSYVSLCLVFPINSPCEIQHSTNCLHLLCSGENRWQKDICAIKYAIDFYCVQKLLGPDFFSFHNTILLKFDVMPNSLKSKCTDTLSAKLIFYRRNEQITILKSVHI